jgi:hypothetical protein
MTEYTNVDISRRLAEADFNEKPDMGVWGKEGESHYFPVKESTDWSQSVFSYCSETLERWLMTKPFFSRRAATIQIAYRAVPNEKDIGWVGHFFVTAWNGGGIIIGKGEAPRKIDALGEVVLAVLAKKTGEAVSAIQTLVGMGGQEKGPTHEEYLKEEHAR